MFFFEDERIPKEEVKRITPHFGEKIMTIGLFVLLQ